MSGSILPEAGVQSYFWRVVVFPLRSSSFRMEYRVAMNFPAPTLARRTPLVLAVLVAITILGFALVSRLVTRLKANEKQIAYHAFEAGMAAYKGNDPDRALDDFRAALSYDRDNPTYQLSLARALRDTGRLDEAEAYLVHLWEASPQDSTVNLALARLAARRHSVDDALRYYHSAIYGLWPTDPDRNRRQTRFELIDFLLQQKAYAQAQAELIGLTEVLPPDANDHIEVADRFRQAGDVRAALGQYELALKLDQKDPRAWRGAGNAAFQLGHYNSATKYLRTALELSPEDEAVREQLDNASLVLKTDPFLRRISDAERNRRLVSAFNVAGDRLKACAAKTQVELPEVRSKGAQPAPSATDSGNALPGLWLRWNTAHGSLRQLNSASSADMPDMLMDLVSQIEQQTAQHCGPPSGSDLALLLIARDRDGVDQ
jgi:tetratricopeptide (TPR) repeat protein